MKRLLPIALLLLLPALRGEGVVLLAEETFAAAEPDPGWISRDADELAVDFVTGFGNAAGSLRGVFAAQDEPAFESDAFRVGDAGSGGDFTGDLYAKYTTFTQLTFDFYALDVLPSTMSVRLVSGSSVFFRSFASQVDQTGVWEPVTIELAYTGWTGGTQTQFENLFDDLDYIDVQLVRNGTEQQTYYLDNVRLWNDEEELALVPEPQLFGLFVFFAWLLGPVRQYRLRSRREGK